MQGTSKNDHLEKKPKHMTSDCPTLALAASFQDMGQYSDAIGWDLDFRQIDPGPLKAGVTAVEMRYGMLMKVGFNRKFHQVGCAPKGSLTFGIPSLDIGDFVWCAANTGGGALLNFNQDGGFESTSLAGFNGCTFSFDADALQTFAASIGYEHPLGNLVRRNSCWYTPETILLSQHLSRLFRALDHVGPDILRMNAELINEEIASVLLETLCTQTEKGQVVSSGYRHMVLKKSMNILMDPERLPITVAQLCAEVSTSQSTLRRLFLAEFGITPKSYIKARCLSGVRDELSRAAPETYIVDVANRWGFWHMGQFARDYRTMFSELPSEMLKAKSKSALLIDL